MERFIGRYFVFLCIASRGAGTWRLSRAAAGGRE